MRIAELESKTGLGRHALRFYEREGLLVGVSRGPNNYRDYPESAVKDATLLQQLQSLGFSLQEIREVLNAMRAKSIDCAQGARLMAEKRTAVDAQIANLRKVSKILMREQQRLEDRAARHNLSETPI
ncbi:MerR family transcriptional regulator [Rhodoferax saidenbachensis]|uniref:DNA-binding transcriptional MerR regulator n=1 Tax=Rhodoferax saidenbachensis TaxID=1484693 RepID=A0ABU1ZJS8_9BURK|nr:MerR family transcriptional regulator [Rhodoferax saidenbachensis]MDR7305125.1 DNA-binding transcriptional MerR regulator [Rhodoferax saidenbachensis]